MHNIHRERRNTTKQQQNNDQQNRRRGALVIHEYSYERQGLLFGGKTIITCCSHIIDGSLDDCTFTHIYIHNNVMLLLDQEDYLSRIRVLVKIERGAGGTPG